MGNNERELPFEKLRRRCDPEVFQFASTAELPALEEIIGQERAVRATAFGMEINSPGYHLFALGPAGTGKTTMIKDLLARRGAGQPVPDDWCYVMNFEDSDKPLALRLPAGTGHRFQADMNRLVEDLSDEMPKAFATKDYDQEKEKIDQKSQQKRQQVLEQLEKATASRQFTLLQTPRGMVLSPTVNGEPLSPEQIGKLSEEQRTDIERRQSELEGELRETFRQLGDIQDEANDEIRRLDQEVAGYAVGHMINRLNARYADLEPVLRFLEAVRKDILENVAHYKQAGEMEEVQKQVPFLAMQNGNGHDPSRYKVNLLVDNSRTQGAPVVFESNPSYPNLLGRMEYQAKLGALVTNLQMIKAGALHRANGGYLIVNARDVLTKPMAWEGLKRALKDREVRLESMYDALGAISTRTLDPEPIPLQIKVVIIGDPMIYYLMYALDEDMRELFKVKADFAVQMDWTEDSLQKYARFIGTICRQEDLRHFAPSGVARIVEESARLVAHQQKLATTFKDVLDLIRQSSYWAGENGNDLVQAEDVRRAVEEQVYRANQAEERLQELIEEGTILIDTDGEAVGQVNGIAVLQLGDYNFGKPSRITAQTSLGRGGLVNIERETNLGGRLHNKGFMIITGYLSGKYAQEAPLTFSASITFEQSYEEVEGDSASSAELYALLSSLSENPLRQDLAVTGSVNQRGQVQAIGGVNEKIEGFFAVCKLSGLTGRQGVLIPESNVKNLMLRDEVVQAVRDGRFHIYPVSTIDQGIEILTGVRAGEPDDEGNYPKHTLGFAVRSRLQDFAEKLKGFGAAAREENPEPEKV